MAVDSMKSIQPTRNALWFAADLVALMRPGQFFPIWATLVAGYAASQWSDWQFGWFSGGFSPEFWLVFLSVTTGSGAVFIYNQIADAETDAINNKLHIIPSGLVTETEATNFAHLLSALTLFTGYLVGPSILTIYIICGLIGLAYSLPPLRWKNHPIFSILVNAVGGASCFLAGFLINQDATLPSILQSTPYFFSWAGVFILVSIPDMKGDATSGKKTPAVAWGDRSALIVGVGLILFAGFIALFMPDWIFLIAFVPVLPLYFLLLFQNRPGVFGPVKWSFILLALIGAVRFPIFFGVLVANLVVLKSYYAYRFGLNYPNLESHE